MSILGNRVVRVEDPRFLRGEGLYVENLALEGALWATFVRSPLAHARVSGVDASAAVEQPNVRVFTAADVDAHPFGPPPHWHIAGGMERPLLARDVVRFAGDIVAVAGMTFGTVPAWIVPTVMTADWSGSTSRETSVCSVVTTLAAIRTGSMAWCGRAA